MSIALGLRFQARVCARAPLPLRSCRARPQLPKAQRAWFGDLRGSRRPSPAWWVRPAAYAAGGTALVVVAWPVLRYVVLGGVIYGVYRLARTWLLLRSLGQGGGLRRDDIGFAPGEGGGGLAEALWQMAGLRGPTVSPRRVAELRGLAEDCVQTAVQADDSRLAELLGDGGSAVELGDAVEVQALEAEGAGCVEASFPVLVGGAASAAFVRASGGLRGGALDAACVLVRLPAGDVAEFRLDVAAPRGDRRRNVPDAEFRDV
ncbi:hypothetical protein GGI04_000360 [Coemansia thaxteri]|uniref:Uncharacterized protein n=1 Tax=Coemansia thaxteri TaxID=2663907 RepID=A0A9W8BK94_9FUNG|nr:hypothetical protein H4R26_000379 [Coemansia thaxteri]KAJ2009561.1 hypothetical protein GGI04_000360 [Coemansia thaxteri]KAJ2474460.1 hypothetical protein GGI02_000082 [Coemansia sp. RSA 2322]KAJ2487699.1 hypothetical protein EV174_000370 [Coemansia sp. RSA 2320]